METSGSTASGYGGATSGGTSAMDQAKQQTQEMVQQGKQAAGQLAEQAREQVKTQISSQKERATETLGSVAGAIRQTGEQLRTQGQEPVAEFTNRAAEMVEQFSGYLREHDVEELYGQVEDFARRNPAIILGSAFALGFMAARFLKSSEQKAYGGSRGYETGSEYGYSGYGAQYGSYGSYGAYGDETGATGRPLASAYDRAMENTPASAMGATGEAAAQSYSGGTTAGATSGSGDVFTGTAYDTEETDEFTGTRRE